MPTNPAPWTPPQPPEPSRPVPRRTAALRHGPRRHPRPPVLPVVLALTLFAAASAPSAAPAAAAPAGHPTGQDAPALTGPPVAHDLDLLAPLGQGLRLDALFGGPFHAMAAEQTRPILWAISGHRVISYRVEGNRLHPLGRSPALPTIASRLVVGDGVVAVLEDGQRGSAWLIDGRDPTWPRAMRPLTLGAPVRDMAIDGRSAVALVGHELLDLDLSDPTAPILTGRLVVDELRDGPAEARVFDRAGTLVALSAPEGDVLILDLAQRGRAAERARLRGVGQPRSAQIVGEHVFVQSDRDIVVHELRDPSMTLPLRWAPTVGLRVIWQMAVVDDQLHVLWHSSTALDLTLHRFRMSKDRNALEIFGEPHKLGTIRRLGPVAPKPLLVASPSVPPLVTYLGRVLGWTGEAEQPKAFAPVALGYPNVIGASALAARDGMLAVGETDGVLSLWDTRIPDSPRLLQRWSIPGHVPTPVIDEALFIGDNLWLMTNQGPFAIDLAQPNKPAYRLDSSDAYIMVAGQSMAQHGNTVFIAVPNRILIFDGLRPWDPARALDYDVLASSIAVFEDRLWVASPTPSGTILRSHAIENGVLIPTAESHDLPDTIGAMRGVAGHLVLLTSPRATQGPDRLQLLDVSDPQHPRPRGDIDLAPMFAVPGLALWASNALLPFDGSVVVAHPNAGLLLIDLSVPDYPSEIARIALPGKPIALAAQGDRLWVGTQLGGVGWVRRGASAPTSAMQQVLLPLLGTVGR